MTQNPPAGYLSPKFEYIYSQRYVHPYVHCSIIHGGQDMETTKVSFDRWLDKDVVHMYKGMALSHMKRWNTSICNHMDGPWVYHAEWNKMEKVNNHMVSFIYEI